MKNVLLQSKESVPIPEAHGGDANKAGVSVVWFNASPINPFGSPALAVQRHASLHGWNSKIQVQRLNPAVHPSSEPLRRTKSSNWAPGQQPGWQRIWSTFVHNEEWRVQFHENNLFPFSTESCPFPPPLSFVLRLPGLLAAEEELLIS